MPVCNPQLHVVLVRMHKEYPPMTYSNSSQAEEKYISGEEQPLSAPAVREEQVYGWESPVLLSSTLT